MPKWNTVVVWMWWRTVLYMSLVCNSPSAIVMTEHVPVLRSFSARVDEPSPVVLYVYAMGRSAILGRKDELVSIGAGTAQRAEYELLMWWVFMDRTTTLVKLLVVHAHVRICLLLLIRLVLPKGSFVC